MLTVPTQARAITNVAQVSLGESQACVRHSDDTLECWKDTQGLPGANGARDIIDVEAGFFRTTAWFRDGSVRTWGDPVPKTPGDARIKRVASGYSHACVLVDDGNVYCYGAAADLHSMTDAIDLAAGFEHTCALLRDRTVRCWGHNEHGQLGDGSNDYGSVPVAVLGLSDVSEIQCGRHHSCARLEDGSIRCWGSNEFGQLGDGTSEDSNTPVRVLGL
ncbi:MAG TPA: hypothetical protein VJR89_41890 [Polyangiales bacterium]|nr:hypothetical protein [Polyangiales bacterium]